MHEEYVARLLLMGIPYTTLSNGCKRWYVLYKYTTYKVIGIYEDGQIAMYNEPMLKKALVNEARFTIM